MLRDAPRRLDPRRQCLRVRVEHDQPMEGRRSRLLAVDRDSWSGPSARPT